FKPDGRQAARDVGISILWHEEAHVPSVGDRDVAVHFDFDVIEIVDQIFLVGNAFQEGRLVVLHASGFLASYPSVTMTEMKIIGEDGIRKRNVTLDNRLFNLLLESQNFGGIRCSVDLRLPAQGIGTEQKAKEHSNEPSTYMLRAVDH